MSTALMVLAGALAGGFVSGLTGFGTALTALGIWLHVLPPVTAATLVALCSVASQLQTLPAVWHAIDRARIWPMLTAGLLGVPAGAWLLERLDPSPFRLCIGLLLLAFSSVLLAVRSLPHIAWGGRAADAAIGFGGGVLGGLAGLSGPLPILWATLRGWDKDARRGVFQAFNLTVLAAASLSHAVAGLVTREVLWLFLFALPGTFVGARLGFAVYRRLSDRRFRDVVLGLLAFSGLTLVWSSL